MSSLLSRASLSLGAGTWSFPMNDITRMCFFSSTTSGQGMFAFFILMEAHNVDWCGPKEVTAQTQTGYLHRLCISFSAHRRMILRGLSLLKRSMKR